MAFAQRFLTTEGTVDVAGRHIKRYHVHVEPRAIEPEIVAAAYAVLPRLLPAVPDATPPASFSILHRGRGGAAYLLAYSWVWDNVIEYHTAAAGVPFLGCPDEDPTHFVELTKPWLGCVWELGPFEHERSAWVRHMLERDPANLAAYLADTMRDGPTGGPTRSSV